MTAACLAQKEGPAAATSATGCAWWGPLLCILWVQERDRRLTTLRTMRTLVPSTRPERCSPLWRKVTVLYFIMKLVQEWEGVEDRDRGGGREIFERWRERNISGMHELQQTEFPACQNLSKLYVDG
eukprot:scaffold146859_cov18-Tisochrysis_lutea.AAC.1